MMFGPLGNRGPSIYNPLILPFKREWNTCKLFIGSYHRKKEFFKKINVYIKIKNQFFFTFLFIYT